MTSSPSLPLTSGLIDRLAERRDDDAWLRKIWDEPTTRVLVVHDGHIDATLNHDALAPRNTAQAPDGERYLLGRDPDGVVWFAVRPAAPPDDFAGVTLREAGAAFCAADATLAVHAIALANWHAAHPRCPRCGAATEVAAAGAQRRCPADGTTHFPRNDPAVIMTVTDDTDRVLLGRHQDWPEERFSTLAGFVEPGETLEAAVAREVLEESGVTVSEVSYLASQPWPFPASLMVGFTARCIGQPEPHADGVELAEVRWFSRDDLAAALASGEVVMPPSISIARWLVERWFGEPLPAASAW